MSKSKDAPAVEAEAAPAAKTAAPKKVKPYVLSEAKRDGKTVRVMTDDVLVWKETA